MANLPSVEELLSAGAHFGHQAQRWNPKMKPYIYGARNGIHIVDLGKTVVAFDKAYDFVADVVASGAPVLFVGTKRHFLSWSIAGISIPLEIRSPEASLSFSSGR